MQNRIFTWGIFESEAYLLEFCNPKCTELMADDSGTLQGVHYRELEN